MQKIPSSAGHFKLYVVFSIQIAHKYSLYLPYMIVSFARHPIPNIFFFFLRLRTSDIIKWSKTCSKPPLLTVTPFLSSQ